MNIMLFGPPGVGKGTQAKLLATKFRIAHVSTGDMLREAAAAGTELGRKAKMVMDAGQLVSDDIMIGIMREVLTSPKCRNGFILDGFPRTVPQAKALTALLEELHLSLDAVINMKIEEQEVVNRLGSRSTCTQCGRIYNAHLDALADPSTCPHCGGALYHRDDDKSETVLKRLHVYAESTAPLREYYQKLGVLKSVTADGSVEAVNALILALLPSR
jgi:adenylate kinase